VTPAVQFAEEAGGHFSVFAGSDLANSSISEASLTSGDARIRDGGPLSEMLAATPEVLAGWRGLNAVKATGSFPFHVTLIDARSGLPLQVQPGVDGVRPPGGQTRVKIWHVIMAEPGAELLVGLRSGVPVDRFRDACRTEIAAARRLLTRIPARPGTTVVIPAGVVHALDGSALLYECSATSTAALRILDSVSRDGDDWSARFDQAETLAAIYPFPQIAPVQPVRLAETRGVREVAAGCRQIAMERFVVPHGSGIGLRARQSPQVVTCLQGRITLETDGGQVALVAGETAIVPAAVYRTTLKSSCGGRAVRAWIPDLVADIILPSVEAAAPLSAIGALAGGLPDIRDLLPAGTTSEIPRRSDARRRRPGSLRLVLETA
jgi:mannose-6-phosphate isomerase